MKKINKIMSYVLIGSLMLLEPISANAYTKKETVYTNLDYTGSPIKTLVNNHLFSIDEGDIVDNTELTKILNINGKEKFSLENQVLTWKSVGKDIFYQGSIEKELPVSVQATYYLDGEEKQVKDILGKKGKVEIHLQFINHAYIESQNIYTPFVVTVGTMISGKENFNITVTNGKVVDTGSKSIIVGIASPGLYESTNIEALKGMNEVIISYDTTKFSLGDIYMVISPKLIEESDFNIFDKMNTLTSSMNTISDSMNQIEAGAKQLQAGAASLKSGSNELSNSILEVLNAISKLEEGSVTLDSSLKTIIAQLQNAQTLLKSKDVDGSIAQLTALKEQNSKAITSLQTVNKSLEQICQTASTTPECVTYQSNQNLIILLQTNNTAIDSTITSLTDISTQITSLITTLNNALVQVEAGASYLTSSLTQLKDGVKQIYGGSTMLVEGANTLDAGMTTLTNGISTLNQNGIQVLMGYTNQIRYYSNRVQQLVNASKNYNGFSANNVENTVFIYKMPSAKSK